MKSRTSVLRDYLHIGSLQVIDTNESTTFHQIPSTKYQLIRDNQVLSLRLQDDCCSSVVLLIGYRDMPSDATKQRQPFSRAAAETH